MLHFQSMISYAQNLEDILLRMTFPSNKGFYIDVGVVFPTIDSVIRLFHDVGWNGINVESQEELLIEEETIFVKSHSS